MYTFSVYGGMRVSGQNKDKWDQYRGNIRDVEKSHGVMLSNEQQYYTAVVALRNGAISQA